MKMMIPWMIFAVMTMLTPSHADDDVHQDAALQAVRDGSILPLDEILKQSGDSFKAESWRCALKTVGMDCTDGSITCASCIMMAG